ncbi:hypothetical protein JTE90_004123 [Oedothorax gibbosus]|uniref:Uncharacterized protein n=1 Tax=Oedothorax gibbosus TaxID=931172 RepID=A0AAV6V210_9ARAC|nr:hypothetical protein JTE90_004123 [Oedothorax gibbosus]
MKKGRRLARIDSDDDQTNIIILESDDESEKVSEVKIFPDNKKNVKEENEIPDKKFNIPNNFFCNVCQLALSSELTWESHIHGKNHAKQIRKQAVYEVSKGSLSVPVTPTIVSENVSRFANAPHGKKLIHINAIPRLQQIINGTRSIPLPGLDYVQEIISDKEVKYYCELCDAPCQSISILPHLVGIRHQLMVVREIAPVFYEQNKIRQDKKFMLKIKSILMTHERREGRGSIKVFREIDYPHSRPAYNQPGPSWRNFSFSSIKKEPNQGESENDTSKDKDRWLDMSKGVFYCTLCDSHMNNLNMWEAHVRGKRHLANAKKIPGESISKMKSERLHGATSILEAMIDEELIGEIVVGLDFVRETRGSNGEIFNCFLCGACSTKIDILDHILLLKHRTKYLEKLHADGFENSIKEIDNLDLKNDSASSLSEWIDDLSCDKILFHVVQFILL